MDMRIVNYPAIVFKLAIQKFVAMLLQMEASGGRKNCAQPQGFLEQNIKF